MPRCEVHDRRRNELVARQQLAAHEPRVRLEDVRQALRLARLEGAALADLSRDQVATLEADDLLEAARMLGENTDARPKRRRWLG